MFLNIRTVCKAVQSTLMRAEYIPVEENIGSGIFDYTAFKKEILNGKCRTRINLCLGTRAIAWGSLTESLLTAS